MIGKGEMAKNAEYTKTQTLEEFVTERIHSIFLELAEIVNNTTFLTLEQAVSIPMKLFQGETLLINVWKQYTERELTHE
jgi:hypothetical protein